VNPAKVKLSKAKNTKGRKLTLQWKKSSTADGYQVQYCANAKFKKGVKSKTIKGAKKTSYTFSKLKKGSYYVRIRAYKKFSGKTYYSGWATKRARIKK